MIQTKGLTYSYGNDKKFEFKHIQSSDEPLLILGPSGCGKTTLLHLLAGLLKPNEGSILWNNQDIHKYTTNQLDSERGAQLGIIFQKPHFVDSLSVYENIVLQANINNKTVDKNDLSNCLETLSISSLKTKKINELSEGEKQRVSIARALINKPKYILADEPTSSLDDTNAFHVIDLLTKQAKEFGVQVLIITHDQRLKDKFSNKVEL